MSKISTLRKNLITLIMSEKYNITDDAEYHILIVTKSNDSKELNNLVKKIKTKKYFGSYTIILDNKLLIAYDATFLIAYNKFKKRFGIK